MLFSRVKFIIFEKHIKPNILLSIKNHPGGGSGWQGGLGSIGQGGVFFGFRQLFEHKAKGDSKMWLDHLCIGIPQ